MGPSVVFRLSVNLILASKYDNAYDQKTLFYYGQPLCTYHVHKRPKNSDECQF